MKTIIITEPFPSEGLTTTFEQYNEEQNKSAEDGESYDIADTLGIPKSVIDRGPHFDFTGAKNVTALVGKTAFLNCCVRNLGNKTVSAHTKKSSHKDPLTKVIPFLP